MRGEKQLISYPGPQSREKAFFVGNIQHQLVTANDMSLYYLSDRPGVTRYMQFDPNITNRLDVQQRITEDLERKRVRVAVLLIDGGYEVEPNESRISGASWLDEYLGTHYDIVGSAYHYVWLHRREGP